MTRPTTATIKRLFAVSGNRCAFPGCAHPLVTAGVVSGEICHVQARRPNGPRYDPRQTDKERHGFENLVLMCPSHHKVIDADATTYTAEKLLEIKARHEARYAGGPQPADQGSDDEIARRLLARIEIHGDVSGQVAAGESVAQVGDVHSGGRVTIEQISTQVVQSPRPARPPYQPPPPPAPDDAPPDPGPLPPGFRLPFRHNPLFTGRVRPLKSLARALLHDGAGATLVTQAVQGMGGIGKTQLAVEFAHRYGRFFHGVHWIDAARPDGIGGEIAACGQAMCLDNWPQEQPGQVALTLRTWQQGGPRLVILDNLEQTAAAREWLARLGGPLRVLLTARRSGWPPDLGLAPLPLNVFTPPESVAFLQAFRVSETPKALDALAERLGHLPLALELAGRYLAAHPRLSPDGYLERLETIWEHRSMAGWRDDLGSPTGHDLDLAATFALSWERVAEEEARRLFLLAGHCAPNRPIPRELFERAAGLDTETCDGALSILTGLGLLEMEEAGTGPLIHPLLAEYARSLPAPGGEADAILPALAAALAALTTQANTTGLPAAFAPLRPHVESAAPAAQEAGLEQAGVLWNEMGYHRKMVADYAAARAAYERALAIDEAAFGPHHPNVAIRVNNLGSVLKALGELAAARAAFERALAIDEAAFGPHHPNVAIRVNNLGSVLQALGELAAARAAFERALAIDEAAFGPHHPNVARDVNNLGSVLHDLGELAAARAAYERALAIDEAAFGPHHPNVARDVNNLGSVLHDLGELAAARAAFERALAIDEAAFGPHHPNVAIRVNNLGSVLKALGELAAARAAFERALAIDEAAFGPHHPNVAIRVNNLGSVLHDLGELAAARAAYERALAIDEAAFGPHHPKVAIRVNNLGSVLQALGELAAARAAFERALAILKKFLPPDHPNIKTVRGNLKGLR